MLDQLRAADVGALCVVAFGQLLKEPLLSEWPCINVHFSLLPAYRGAAPVERALMDGVAETGVCIMRMDAGLDTGPVAREIRIAVEPQDDAGAVMTRLCAVAVPALVATLDDLERGDAAFAAQAETGVSLAPKIGDADRALDPGDTAVALANRIRALAPYIGARLVIDGAPFKIWRANVPAMSDPGAGLHIVDGRLLIGVRGRGAGDPRAAAALARAGRLRPSFCAGTAASWCSDDDRQPHQPGASGRAQGAPSGRGRGLRRSRVRQ